MRNVEAKTFDGRLEEISVAGRALRVQLEIFHAAVVQDDDLDVLAADIDDHMRIFVELQRRLGMGDGFDQRYVGVENVFENVFRVTRSRDAENFQFCVLRFDLAAQVLEHFDRVLDRVAVRELVGLAENVAVFVQQYSFGRSRAAVDADETADGASCLKNGGREFLVAIGFFEDLEVGGLFDQAFAAGLGFLFLAAEVDIVS